MAMSTATRDYLRRLAHGERLEEAESHTVFLQILNGQANDVEIASLLTALAVRGETVDEIVGGVRAMRDRMIAIDAPAPAIDVCGTGGDGRHTLNISTAVSFVVAACGVPMAKHGNRALTSRAGAADVLEALGVAIDLPTEALAPILADTGIIFLFAPQHHPGLRQGVAVRALLGFRTIFNLLGPLSNPARVRRQLIGVYDPAKAPLLAQAAGRLGAETVWVVHGAGTDELSLAGDNQVTAWDHGELRQFTIDARELGLAPRPVDDILGGDAAQNAQALQLMLEGDRGAYRDTVLLNAAAALVVAQRCRQLHEAVNLAAWAIDSTNALQVLQKLRAATAAYREKTTDAGSH